MNHKGYNLTIFSIVVLALCASVVIYPSQKEESLMYFYDRRYEDAYENFIELYQKGDHSTPVVIPLVWLDLHFAKGDHAANILREYVDDHPTDIEAKHYLKDLLFDISRPQQHLSLSKEIYGISNPENGLSYEERLYSHIGNFKEQKSLLEKVTKHRIASQDQYVELAYLLASEGEMNEAIATIDRLIEHLPPATIKQETMLFVIRAQLNFGDRDKAHSLALKYIHSFSNFEVVIALIDLFNSRGDEKFVIRLLDELPSSLQTHPVILMSRGNQFISMGRSDLAYRFLKKQFGVKPPKEIARDFFLLALDQEEDEDQMLAIIEGMDFSTFKKEDLYQVVRKLIVEENRTLASKIASRIPREVINANPTVSFAFELAKHPACDVEEDCIEKFQEKYDLDDPDRAFIASLYHLKGYDFLAQEELLELETLENIPGNELFELARLYVDLDLSDEGLELVEDLKEKNPPKETEVDEAWIYLAAEEGLVEEVIDFLEEDDTVDDEALNGLFYLAVDREYNKLAYDLALELNEKNSTPHSREMLALAFVLNGKIAEGMNIFDDLLRESYGQSDGYFYGLTIAAKHDEKYRELLQKIILDRLRESGLSEEKKREYAFILLENEFSEDAASLFFDLSQDKDFLSDEVQSLLAVWGKKTTPTQMDWILGRAWGSTGKDKGQWLEYLVYLGNPKGVIDIISKSDLDVVEIADAYIGAATTLKDKELIADAITQIYPREKRLPRLRELGDIARYSGLKTISREIYTTILKQYPRDAETLKAMGFLYYDEGAYCLAKSYFKRFLECSEENSYQVNYYLGEILWVENKKSLANKFYDCALNLICKEEKQQPYIATIDELELSDDELLDRLNEIQELEEQDRARKSTKGQIYHRLGKPYLAICVYNDLIRQYPESLILRIELAHIMMDLAGYRSAVSLLCCRDFCKTALRNKELNIDFYLAISRLLKESNYVAQSIELLKNIYCHVPSDDGRVDASLAASYFVGGHWHQAMHYISQAIEKKPFELEYRKARKEIVWEHLPFVNVNYEYRSTGEDQREHFYRYHAFSHISPFIALEGKADFDHIRLGELTSVEDGVIEPFCGLRKRGELAVYLSNWCGDLQKGTFYFAESTIGAGIEWKKYSYKDIFTLGFDWNRPDWENIQSTIERGTRDQIYAERYHRFNRFWELDIGLAGNRYNLWHFSSAAVTWELESLLTFKFPQQPHLNILLGENAELTLNYQIDKEQIDRLKKKIDVDGEKYAPLPLTNRETHTFFVFLSKTIHDCWATEGYFGYLYDRVTKGSAHPVGGAAVVLWKDQQTQARFDYNHSASTEDVTQTTDSFMFNLRHIF